jgi:hypothetical protein
VRVSADLANPEASSPARPSPGRYRAHQPPLHLPFGSIMHPASPLLGLRWKRTMPVTQIPFGSIMQPASPVGARRPGAAACPRCRCGSILPLGLGQKPARYSHSLPCSISADAGIAAVKPGCAAAAWTSAGARHGWTSATPSTKAKTLQRTGNPDMDFSFPRADSAGLPGRADRLRDKYGAFAGKLIYQKNHQG